MESLDELWGVFQFLNRVTREGLTEKVTLEQIWLKLGKGANHVDKWKKRTLGRREWAVQRP